MSVDKMNFKGPVLFEEDLFEIKPREGDVYLVTYSGSRTDSPEKVRRIDACFCYFDGWHQMVTPKDEIKYHIFKLSRVAETADFIVAQAEVNKTEGSMKITDVYPYQYNTPEMKIRLLIDCVLFLGDDVRDAVFDSEMEAALEFMRIRNNLCAYHPQ